MSVQSKTAAFFKKNKKDSSLLPQQFRVGYSFHCQYIYFLMSWHTSLVVESWCTSKILGDKINFKKQKRNYGKWNHTELSVLGMRHIQTLCFWKKYHCRFSLLFIPRGEPWVLYQSESVNPQKVIYHIHMMWTKVGMRLPMKKLTLQIQRQNLIQCWEVYFFPSLFGSGSVHFD